MSIPVSKSAIQRLCAGRVQTIWQFHPLTDVDTSCNLLPLLKAAMCVWGKEASERQIGEPRSSQCSHDPLKALMGHNKTSRMRWQRTCHYYSGFFWDVEKVKFHSVTEKGQWGRAGISECERRAIANLKAEIFSWEYKTLLMLVMYSLDIFMFF